ncbi:MAG: hypothetical protein QXS37_02610 [Candidatus Aenigmatarchaeota archaeon]
MKKKRAKNVQNMCKICEKLNEINYKEKMNELYNTINERLKAAKRKEREDEFAFSTSFPLIDFPIFEPRMALQIPSNFYQNVVVDGKRLRNDWASGWIRAFGFKDKNLYFITHAYRTREGKEYLIYLYMVEFSEGEYKIIEEGNKFTVEVKDVKKEGIDLINDKRIECSFSFSFVHQMTETSILPRDRVERSALLKKAYEGRPIKPLIFDFTEYVITVPHFAFYPIVHSNFSKFGYKSALEMQKDVINILKKHLQE